MQSDEQPSLIRTLKGHKQSIMCLDLHPTCRYAASAGMDNAIFLWDLTKIESPHRLQGHKNQVHDLKFSPNGSMLVSASSDQSLKFWEVDNDCKARQITLVKAHNARIRAVGFSCDGLLLSSCGDDKLVKVWSTIDRRLQFTLKKHQNWVRYCQFSPTATNVVSCDDKLIHIWDLSTKKCIQTYQQHSGVIHQVKFHSLGSCMASCSHDKKIKLYDVRSQRVIQIYQGHDGPVKSIDFHPHCAYLISSSDDGTTKIWNSQKGRLEYTLMSHSNASIYSRQGDYFMTGGYDKTVNIWKSGFFDSLKQSIMGSQTTIAINRKRVIPNTQNQLISNNDAVNDNDINVNNNEHDMKTINNNTNNSNKNDNNNVQGGRRVSSVYYNHIEQHFELQNCGLNQKNAQKQSCSIQLKDNNMLPPRLVAKLQRINSQLDFISKTTQILQSRVQNNTQQLQRLISIIKV